jgi:hypothetical protein
VRQVNNREAPENLLLACNACHRRIDHTDYVGLYTAAMLTKYKETHEARVRDATNFATLQPTVVLTMSSPVRGTVFGPEPRTIGATLIANAGMNVTDETRSGRFDIKVQGDETQSHFWESAQHEIDRVVGRWHQDREDSSTAQHLSVFAAGPIPLLTYLGSRLDDKTPVALYQPHRRDRDDWSWPAVEAKPVVFDSNSDAGDKAALDVVVLVSASADVQRARIPAAISHAPVMELRPTTRAPGPDLVDSLGTLKCFASAWRELLAKLESNYPLVRSVHVIAAVPITAAIELGRNHMRTAQADLVMYQRTDLAYTDVLRIH